MIKQPKVFLWGFIPVSLIVAAILFTVVTMCVSVTGCKSNPISAATNTEQRAYALYGTFVIFEEQAAQLKKSGELPAGVVTSLQNADKIAKPSADALLKATLDYETAAHQLQAGVGTPEKLSIATANLTQWVTIAESDISALVTAVKGQ